MATKRQAARINDENGFFDESAPPARPALVRMERDRGTPRTAQVHPAEVERWQARGWRRA